MKKLHREVVILPEEEHAVLVKIAGEMNLPKSRIFRLALKELDKTRD